MFFNRPNTGGFNTHGAGAWGETKEDETKFDGRLKFGPKDDIVDIEAAKRKIDNASSSGNSGQSEAPTTNPGADRIRNRQSDMTALLQQYGKVPLDPALGGVAGFGLGMVMGDGKPLPALLGAGAGYLLGKSNSILLPGQKPEGESEAFDASQAIEGTAPVESQTEAVSQEKADISGMYPGVDQLTEGGMAFAPGFTNAAANRSNTFGQDVTTLLAQSAKTTGDQVQGGNMQPKIDAADPGLEVPAPGGQPGNVPNPADELLTSFSKGRVPSYVFQTLGGGSVA